MQSLEQIDTSCPYCGEVISLFVDCSIEYQEYIEDCSVCCRPIEITCSVGSDGGPDLTIKSDNE